MDLFVPTRFKTHIQLSQRELADADGSIEDLLLDKLRSTHENIYTRFGYIRGGSLSILKRSAGSFVKQHFNGYIRYELFCRGEICEPAKGAVYEAVVRNKNALGIHAEAGMGDDAPAVLDIIIPKRAAGIQSEVSLDDLQPGDHVFVEVLGKKNILNDRQISIIGRAVAEPKKTPAASAGPTPGGGSGGGELGGEMLAAEEAESDGGEFDGEATEDIGSGDEANSDDEEGAKPKRVVDVVEAEAEEELDAAPSESEDNDDDEDEDKDDYAGGSEDDDDDDDDGVESDAGGGLDETDPF